eukprot:GEMP01000140.1.p1 GENE.GEMP01000140.1~~GEMP01000140.1.p1  ORF type:complete len:2733 (+),score=458.69 GEMP01000140.1:292-8199(+)
MGRFFAGLASSGAWACFDEFNRIQVEVLSVIAQQMLTIQQAVRQRKKTFEFIGRDVNLNPRFGVMITMNPGYAGRTELPDNLKSLFRPVAMMVPDYALIAQIILYSEGFAEATNLSRKMVNMYRLASEQLSKQDHYDFGMRAVKSVLVMAGQLKRKSPNLSEDVTLIRALRDSNVPKFLSYDVPLFTGIISDLFPGVDIPNVDYGNLQIAIESQIRSDNFQPVPAFVAKIIQLLETQLVRHGVMVVGLTCSGKSTNVNTLARSLTQLKKDGSTDPAHQLTKIFSLNPKSVKMNELYGSFNLNTGEWFDGLIAILVRQAVTDTTESKKWVNFDGPVDAIWIENMNTVLDDNKMLCLANSERIKLPPTMTMMFEVNDLCVASPATVSRCGMVYLEHVHLGVKCLLETWGEIKAKSYPKMAPMIMTWAAQIVKVSLPFIRDNCKQAPGIPAVEPSMVKNYLNLIDAFINHEHGIFPDEEGKQVKSEKQLDSQVRMYTAFAAVWSLGGNLHESSRAKFVEFIRPHLTKFCPELPQTDNLYSIYVDDDNVRFVDIRSLVPVYEYNASVPFFNILVPTSESTTQKLLLENLMHASMSVLFSGETGVGKSVIIQQFLSEGGETYSVATTNFSAQTSASNVVDLLENSLERKRKNLLGAPPGTVMLMFIDDLNMPMTEVYGAQPPIELLRQVIDYRGFYDLKKLFWKNVQDLVFIAACGPPGGGRMTTTPRLVRHFMQIWMEQMSEDAMNRILSSILGGWLRVGKPSFADLAVPIVEATVKGFFKISSDLLPTPIKCHYTFNMRDPCKMVQGMMMVDAKKTINTKDDLLNLWIHEGCRLFRDRLINEQDRNWYSDMMASKMKEYVKVDWDPDTFEEIMFGDFFNAEKTYLIANDEEKVNQIFNEFLDDYNVTYPSQMNLVFFRDARQHLARICRIIRQPRGNALLIGVSGVGRKSLARMAAHMADFKCSSIEITRSYDTSTFREDLKEVMMTIVKNSGKGLVFSFGDTQIVKEDFLENLNNILNTGEIPNLFAPDEVEQILGYCRPLAKAAGKPDMKDAIWNHFVQVVREEFHVVLAFSPIGDAFRARCRQFPSIINCCTIDWFNPWPSDALYSVAERYYLQIPADLGVSDTVGLLSQMSCAIHSTSTDSAESFFEAMRRRTYTTPTSYLELIALFIDKLKEKKGELTTKLERYKVGVTKLTETSKIVDKLGNDLQLMEPQIAKAQIETKELMEQVEIDQKTAAEQQAACAIDEKAATETAHVANTMKSEVQSDLDQALPEYYTAIKALDSLDKKDIQEVKSFSKPPALVEVVLGAVCLLMGKKESWDEAKKLMNDSNFLQSLKSYDKEALSLNSKLTAKMQKYVKREDFQAETVKKVSLAAMSLCMWVRAMDVYGRVSREIGPKKEKLAVAEASLAKANETLAGKKAELKLVTDKVAALRSKLAQAKRKAEQLVKDSELCKVKLNRAEQLTSGLGDESVRWDAASVILERDLQFVVGNVLLAAGFISYIGPYNVEFRKALVADWILKAREIDLPADPEWKLANVLVDPAEVRQWNILGLPEDDLSIENGILVTRGRRWSLMIDPQGQANSWIRSMGKDRNINIIKLTDANFLRTLENGIRYGQAILLENVEEVLDPSLEPVLTKQIFKKGGQWLLHLGDQDIPYSDEFGFYITTKMANPHYLPEICIKVTIINFTVTLNGLEDQLVSEVLGNERPELTEQKSKLVVQIAEDKAEIDRLEKHILHLLAESKGDILMDETLITVLKQSKETGEKCKERMTVAEEAMQKISTTTETLRPAATRASMLYFSIANMGSIDPMYQYSLDFFVGLVKLRLQNSEKSEELNHRVEILISDFTNSSYFNICRGLFEDHKMVFSFLITAQILRHAVHCEFLSKIPIHDTEWLYLLRGSAAGKGLDYEQLPCPSWLPEVIWEKIQVLENVTKSQGCNRYDGLSQSFISAAMAWESYYVDDEMTNLPIPGGFDEIATPFMRLLIIFSLRENLFLLGAKRFIKEELGALFIESPPFDLEGAFADSKSTAPMIFILSAGADPTQALIKLAHSQKYQDRLHFISLGQGQGPKAERLIEVGREDGDWVCLMNCHLAASWMGTLDRIQEQQDADKIDPDYRLWLTSMPSPAFPVVVLQSGIKITNEPPKGLKANVGKTFTDISEDFYESCPSKPSEFKKLLFVLGFFHGVILERRKFGPIGWNIPYDWMDSDFKVSSEQVHMYLTNQPGVPWSTLNYIIAEVNYGGRVTDDKDVRLISAVLKRYFTEAVLEDNYKLSSLDTYFVPAASSLDDIRAYIRTWPLEENPKIFGLHPNALTTAQFNQCRQFVDTIISVQPRISSGGGVKPEDVVADMSDKFKAQVPEEMDKRNAHELTYAVTSDGKGVISLGVFHGQEVDRFNSVLEVVIRDLSLIKKAIKGFVVMSAELEEMYNAFLVQKVPQSWLKVAYPCLKPLNSWMSDFMSRMDFMNEWLLKGPPVAFWLSCFFFPQGFMTASMQVYARQTEIAIDTLIFRTNVTTQPVVEDMTEIQRPEAGVYIYGLFIQGCGWDLESSCIVESNKNELFVLMPMIGLEPVIESEQGPPPPFGVYQCPLYKTSERRGVLSTTGHSTNFVMFLNIQHKKDDDLHWVRRGVALLCMLDD